ncbi:MAG: hypothetical protein QXJ75_03725 [Candidatus Bathyarchaeia archaeon]
MGYEKYGWKKMRKEDKIITIVMFLFLLIFSAIYASMALPQIAGLPYYYPFKSPAWEDTVFTADYLTKLYWDTYVYIPPPPGIYPA